MSASVAFTALMLVVGWKKEHPAFKKLMVEIFGQMCKYG